MKIISGRHTQLIRILSTALCWSLLAAQVVAAQTDYAQNIASLIDPAKLATLGKRGANPRVQKAVYWLASARKHGQQPSNVLDQAVALAGYKNSDAAKLTRDALLRNLDIAGKLGSLNDEGLAEMRQGKAATVMTGPYKGDQLSVDHIVPRAVVPELDNVIANLVDKFTDDPIMRYNLACYECQLGRLEQAKNWLEKAFTLGDPKKIKLMALQDPDLEPLWREIGQL
jgi:hypothetical protein